MAKSTLVHRGSKTRRGQGTTFSRAGEIRIGQMVRLDENFQLGVNGRLLPVDPLLRELIVEASFEAQEGLGIYLAVSEVN